MWFYWFQNQQLNMNCFVYLCSPILDVSQLFAKWFNMDFVALLFVGHANYVNFSYAYVSLTGVV